MSERPGMNAAELAEAHTPEAVRVRLGERVRHSYLSDFIYGGIDGAVTTFAVVSGVAGAGLSPTIIVVLGCANLVGDGFSMAAANFLGVRADTQQRERTREQELREIELHPEGEREEIRQIFRAKGVEGDALDAVVAAITSNRDRWVEAMLTEEHGLARETRSAKGAALATLVAFTLVGAVPLLPFAIELFGGPMSGAYAVSTALVGVAFFAVGAAKCRFVEQKWWAGGLETRGVGGLAALLAFVVGWLLGMVAPEAGG